MEDEKIALILTGLFFLVMGLTLISGKNMEPYNGDISNSLVCESDSDCVAGGECCHPSECVNIDYAEKFYENNCQGVACMEICMPCPKCKCIKGECTKTGERSIQEGSCC